MNYVCAIISKVNYVHSTFNYILYSCIAFMDGTVL